MAWNAGPACAGISGRLAWNPHAEEVFARRLGIDPRCIWSAGISRLDLAVDVPGVRVDQCIFRFGKSRCARSYIGGDGETRYLGSRSGHRQFRGYDKRPEIIESNRRRGSWRQSLQAPVPSDEVLRLEIVQKG